MHSEVTGMAVPSRADRAARMREIAAGGATGKVQSTLRTLGRLRPYLRKARVPLFISLGCMAVVATMTIAFGQSLRLVIDNVPTSFDEGTRYANLVLAGALTLVVFHFAIAFTRMYCVRLVALRVTEELRKAVFESVTRLGVPFIESKSSGELQTRIIADTTALGVALANQVPVAIKASFMLVASIGACIWVNAELTLIVALALPVILLPMMLLSKSLRQLAQQWQSSIARAGAFAGESFRRAKVVHAFNRQQQEQTQFDQRVDEVSEKYRRMSRREIGLNMSSESLSFAAFAVIVWVASKDIFTGRMTVGALVSFAFYVQASVVASRNLVHVGTALHMLAGMGERILEYIDSRGAGWQREDVVPLPRPVRGEVELRDVRFSYPTRADKEVLKGVTLRFPPQSFVAIVGASGSGKSTLLELLLSIHPVNSGEISIDGVDLRHLSVVDLCANLGFVPQTDSLVSGSVLENINFGAPEANLATAMEAAKRARAHEFIAALDGGYHADLGEVGGRLSGGQRQRISIARALVRQPPILLLDEPTSALDEQGRREVDETLRAASKHCTVISVTHSMAAASLADHVVVLEDGRVAAQGSPQELARSSEAYRRLNTARDQERSVLAS